VGDVLRVTTRMGEPFAGVCISIRRAGVDSAVLLRGQMFKVGVELWYKIFSPSVIGIDIIWRRPKRARRARLFYMRQPKHDRGSVDDLVFAWKKERAALRGRVGGGGGGGQKGNQTLGMRF
jgi:ribosomal protein L19